MKGVIFDFNGTLFLDNDKHILAWNRISQLLRGCDITEEELHVKMNGKNNKDIIAYLTEGKADSAMTEACSQQKEACYRQYCAADRDRFHLIPGAEDLFDYLASHHIPFTIASASIKPNIDFFVDSFHLDRWIDPDTIVYDDGKHLGKISMFQDAAGRLGMDVSGLTIVEDSLAGICCAIQAGCQDVRVINSAGIADKVKDLPQVRQVCEDMTEIIRSGL